MKKLAVKHCENNKIWIKYIINTEKENLSMFF